MKSKKLLCSLAATIFILFTVFNCSRAQAAQMKISIPKIEIVSEPKLQYEYGDNISVTVASPNYTGRVEYRVMLYNGTTGKTTELWNIPVANINASLYMPRVLIYSINDSYIMWVEGLNEPIYVERIR